MLDEDIRKTEPTPPFNDQERATPVLQKNWQDLIKPTKLNVAPGRDPARFATVVAEPLERGFGLTLGNALRRVLLSSLQGAAITSVHIDGVLHEFSSIPGVREDVTNIVLNIKEIAISQHSEGIKRMVLQKEGPGVATAGDIQGGSEVEILNPEHVICTLDEGAAIHMEFTSSSGKGYVPAERNRPDDAPIGFIPAVDGGYLITVTQLPPAASLARTDEVNIGRERSRGPSASTSATSAPRSSPTSSRSRRPARRDAAKRLGTSSTTVTAASVTRSFGLTSYSRLVMSRVSTSVRLDTVISERIRGSFRIVNDEENNVSNNAFAPGVGYRNNYVPGRIITGSSTQVLSPTMVNDTEMVRNPMTSGSR